MENIRTSTRISFLRIHFGEMEHGENVLDTEKVREEKEHISQTQSETIFAIEH